MSSGDALAPSLHTRHKDEPEAKPPRNTKGIYRQPTSRCPSAPSCSSSLHMQNIPKETTCALTKDSQANGHLEKGKADYVVFKMQVSYPHWIRRKIK